MSSVGRVINVLAALLVSAAVLALFAVGYGPVPALGRALVPGHGAWASAPGGQPIHSQTLSLPGLAHPVSVAFTSHGVASVRAADEADAYLALGYLHARFRLTEMDLERRLGEGRIAQLAGPAGLSSDRFELRLGLLRTAQAEWAATPRTSPAAQVLIAYSRGVNDYLAQARRTGQWPSLFGLTGVYPTPWTPTDSLVLQGVLTQELDYTTTPLDYAILARTLGPHHTMAWFPLLAPGRGTPYDPGPYKYHGLAPIAPQSTTAFTRAAGRAASPPPTSQAQASGGGAAAERPAGGEPAAMAAGLVPGPAAKGPVPGPAARVASLSDPSSSRASGTTAATTADDRQRAEAPVSGPGSSSNPITAHVATAAAAMLAQANALPAGLIHEYPDSNAWAANGPKVSGAKSMLAGDPHLPQTVPSIWYQVALSAPGLSVTGVSVPGLPGVLIGHNAHIAWSLTDTQNQATLFYTERTSKTRPGQYFWRGAWRRMRQVHYTIPVRGGPAVHLTVNITVHGPVMTQAGQTTSVDWMGNIPSPDISVIIGVTHARDFAQFHAALADWRAPSQNFVYADDRGNIGAISAGYYPLVRHGDPWLPMPGTGADDVAGVIPYASVPQVYDPPGHVVATANQRPVGPSYPYYIGTSANFFDPGYRAGEIYASLRGQRGMHPASFAAIQLSLTDRLAQQIVPRLLAALRGAHLSAQQQEAAALLHGWDATMAQHSAAAPLWWTFWGDYLDAVFRPWWKAAKVPVHKDPPGLAISPQNQFSLDQVLASWTTGDPANSAFSPPGGPHRTAPEVMRAAFATAVAHLAATLHGAPSSWAWGRIHSRQFPSVTQADALGYGPRASGADSWTVNAADGGLVSHQGPSWRMIVAWAGHGTATGESVYPGGQSENPASPWYEDQMADWWDGRYLALPPAGGYPAGQVRWSLRP
ncbi:MAG TPA: penicillin acylase family protein [Streptosporangiaceae bacterium]|nr:penicillin acylase family protein [Streptosporangiaceae bacterium]